LGARSKPDKRGSERTCVVTGDKGPPEDMIHFALSPNGEVVPDLRRKLPGRGVWTRLSSATVDEAVRKQAFSRGFKTKAAAPPDLAARLDLMIEQDALQFHPEATQPIAASWLRFAAPPPGEGITGPLFRNPDGAWNRAAAHASELFSAWLDGDLASP